MLMNVNYNHIRCNLVTDEIVFPIHADCPNLVVLITVDSRFQ